jgi:beta-glucosidase
MVQVSVKITNTGTRDGDDIVQIYLSYGVCRITQPVERLCAFKRISLAAGSSQVISFVLGTPDLAFLNEELRPEINIGPYSILVGSSSQDGLRGTLEVLEVA